MTQLHTSAPPKPTEIAAPAERIGFLIYRTGLLISQAYETRMRPLGYSPVEVGVLTYLASDRKSHVRGIARALGVSPQTVVNVTLSLERRLLVQRTKSALDLRATRILLTQDGLDELRKIDAIAKAFDEEIAGIMGAAPAAAVVQGLKALLEEGVS